MALQDIKQAIIDEAEKKAADIIAAANQQAVQIKAEWQVKIDQKKQHLLNDAKLKTNKKIQQNQFKLQAANQTMILEEKRKIINKVYQAALQKLNDLDDAKYVELMEKFINQITVDGELISAKGKEALLKKAMKKSSAKLQLSKEVVNVGGGFIFHAPSMEIDYTFNALINNVKERSILGVSEILFAKNQSTEIE